MKDRCIHILLLSRWAVHHDHESIVWSEVNKVLLRESPTLFESFSTPDELLIHLDACAESPISKDYVYAIAKYYQNHVDLFQTHANQIFTAMEKLIIQDGLKAAECFMEYVIIGCFNSITNHEELLQTFTRFCPLVPPASRDYFCKNFIASLSYELSNKKYPKKLAPFFFDLLLAILDLRVMQAPSCAYRVINISEFYPWKQLDKQLTRLIQSCVTYDTVTDDSKNEPNNLTGILTLIKERGKVNKSIFQATHQVALQAIFKWSSIIDITTGQLYPKQAFTMGEVMTHLLEQQKITADICMQLLQALQKRIENNDESKTNNAPDDSFLVVRFLQRATSIIPFSFLECCLSNIWIYARDDESSNCIT